MNQPIYISDDEKETVLSTFENANIADFVCHEACKQYISIYRNRKIPLSYFEFMFDEFQKHSFASIKPVINFFDIYKSEDILSILENYMNNTFTLIQSKQEKHNKIYFILKKDQSLEISLSDQNVYGKNNPQLYKSLDAIRAHIENGDEMLSKKDLYERFMLRRYLVEHFSSSLEKLETSENRASNANNISEQLLVGQATQLPDQKGKVVKMFFPKLSLPSAYPSSQEKSRVNSDYRVKKLMKVDNQITLINKYKFNNVKYKASFIEKRKLAQKPKKKKFDFDF